MKSWWFFLPILWACLASGRPAASAAESYYPDQELRLGARELDLLDGFKLRPERGLPAVNHGGESTIPRPVAVSVEGLEQRRLLARPKELLLLDGHDDPNELAALEAILEAMLGSAEARLEASKLIAKGQRVYVAFGDIPDSALYSRRDGSITVAGKAAVSGETPGGMFYVTLNKLWLGLDRWPKVPPELLAHELLGHIPKLIESERLGIGLGYSLYEHAETDALLLQWIVQAELKMPLDDPGMWEYLRSETPRAYANTLIWEAVEYSDSLSSEDMTHPLPIYRRRLHAARDRLWALEKTNLNGRNSAEETIGCVQDKMTHFIQQHGMPSSRFSMLRQACEYTLSTHLPGQRNTLKEILEHLNLLIKNLQNPATPQFLEELRRASASPWLTGMERSVQERTARLRRIVAGKNRSRESAGAASDQITQDELERLYKEDIATHPEHWWKARKPRNQRP